MLVCILSDRPEASDLYVTTLNGLGIDEVKVTADIPGLFDLLTSKPVCGIALDIPSIVRADKQGKQLLNSISDSYPIVKLNLAPGKEIRVIGNHFLAEKEPPLVAFALACKSFQSRTWRKDERFAKVVNLYWAVENDVRNRGFTLDVSRGGCFVCTLDPPPVGTIVSLELLAEKRTVKARITWAADWGKMERAPGFGCKYLE